MNNTLYFSNFTVPGPIARDIVVGFQSVTPNVGEINYAMLNANVHVINAYVELNGERFSSNDFITNYLKNLRKAMLEMKMKMIVYHIRLLRNCLDYMYLMYRKSQKALKYICRY